MLYFEPSALCLHDADSLTKKTPPHKIEPQVNAVTNTGVFLAAHTTLLTPQTLVAEGSRSRSTTPLLQAAPDASFIVTWPAAVKHVTKNVVPSETACARIRHLINEQRKHEQQWWTQRQAIVVKHNGRAHSNAKVADILKDLGGLAAPTARVDELADKNELEAFDKKVYKSSVQMASDFDGQLRKLGIPFFAIKHDLVSVESKNVNDLARKGRLDRGELRHLQRRMLQYLEDLLMDD